MLHNTQIFISSLLTVCILLLSLKAEAQRPVNPGGSAPGGVRPQNAPGGGNRNIVADFIDTDSFSVAYIYKEEPWDTLYRGDTSLYQFYHLYDPARRRTWDLLHIGMPGSPARPVYFDLPYLEGNHLGVHVYDSYIKRSKNLAFYFPDRPFADLAYLRGADQDDFVFDAVFSNTFSNGLNFSMEYQRIGQIGEYRNQRSRNTTLTMGLSYSWWKERIQSYFIFSNTGILQENSGGISSYDVFNDPRFNTRIGIEVLLSGSRTKFNVQEYELYNSLEAPFSTRFPLKLYNSLKISNENFLFFETPGQGGPINEQYFGPFLNDPRGIRHGVRLNTVRNEIGLDISVDSIAGFEVEKIRGGIIQRWISWQQEPNVTRLNEFHVFAEGYLKLFNRIDTKGRYQQGILNSAGNSNVLIEGKILLPGNLNLLGTYERSSILPSLISQSVNISFRNVYTTDFNVQRINKIKGGLKIINTGTSVEAGVLRGIDLIVFNPMGFPEQLDIPTNVLQIAATQEFSLWHFKWYHYLLYQATSETKLGIPTWFYKSSLFWEKKVSRGNSPLRIGIDFRILPDFFSLTYLPLHAQWAYQNEQPQELFPELDVFVALKVKVFRAFVRFENVIGLINNRPLFHHYRYPMHEQRLSIGIQWILPD